MTRNTNLDPDGQRNADVNRGRVGTSIAGTPGMTFRDGTTTARQIRDVTVVGATLTDNDDGTAVYTIGEGDPGDPGITDHGILTGLGDDDHPQYTTNAEVLALIIANAPGGGEPLTNSNEVTPELIFAGGDVVMVGGGAGGAGGVGDDLVDPTSYGALLDCQQVYDAVVTAGTLSTVTSATAAFTSADTGKTFYLASTAGNVTTGTVTFVNSTTATMSTAAGGAMTGARFIWGTNDLGAWQAALNAALPGQTVDVASGSFRSLCAGQLNVPDEVTLGRFKNSTFDPQTNPAGNTHGPTIIVGEHATLPFITLNVASGLGDFIFYSANQVPPTAATPTAFAACVFTDRGGCHIGNPYFANFYHALQLESGRHHVGRPQIGALKWGVTVDQCFDVIDIDYITCHPYWRICEGMAYTPTAGSLDEYALNQATGLVMYRADGLHVGTLFTFGMYATFSAYDSPDTGLSPRAGWALIGKLEADSVAYGMVINSTADTGVLVGVGRFSAHPAGVGTAGQAAVITTTGGVSTPEVVVGHWSHRGTWANAASDNNAGTLIVPATNPG